MTMHRYLMGLTALVSLASAQAQTEVRPMSPAQTLACLVKPERAPEFPQRDKLDRAFGAMRVLLKFKQPDASPEIEVLFNSAREDMQDEVYRYLRGYRLPCLTSADGTVSAVQEFSFSNTDRAAMPLPPERAQDALPFCLVMPRRSPLMPSQGFGRPEVSHVVIAATFTGNGQQGPEVKVLYSAGSDRAVDEVREYLAQYRMPCRTGTEGPQTFQQMFSFHPSDLPRYAFKREAFRLVEFLAMIRDVRKLRATYDFTTMGCPFKLHYVVYGGAVPNEATAMGKPDPNKLPFLAWLAGLELDFRSQAEAQGLFGSELQIEVPCGSLNLPGEGARPAG